MRSSIKTRPPRQHLSANVDLKLTNPPTIEIGSHRISNEISIHFPRLQDGWREVRPPSWYHPRDDIGLLRGCPGNLILFEVPPKMPPSPLISVHTVGCVWRCLCVTWIPYLNALRGSGRSLRAVTYLPPPHPSRWNRTMSPLRRSSAQGGESSGGKLMRLPTGRYRTPLSRASLAENVSRLCEKFGNLSGEAGVETWPPFPLGFQDRPDIPVLRIQAWYLKYGGWVTLIMFTNYGVA